MTKRKGEYTRIADRDEEGQVAMLVDPLDYLILAELPVEGASLGGVIPLGETVRNLSTAKFDGLVDPGMLSGRFMSLSSLGYVKRIKLPRSDLAGWQITERGQKVLANWKKTQTNHEEEGS